MQTLAPQSETGQEPQTGISRYEQLCCRQPGNAAAHFQLGRLYRQAGFPAKAHRVFMKALLLAPEHAAYKTAYAQIIDFVAFNAFSPPVKKALALCLEDPNLPHRRLSGAWMAMARFDPDLLPLTRLLCCADYGSFRKAMDIEALGPVLNEPFLTAGLRRCITGSPEFERLFRNLRRFFLLEAAAEERRSRLPFLCALALQCFCNEYVYNFTAEEEKAADRIRRDMETGDGGFDPARVALLGCYHPLHRLKNAAALAEEAAAPENTPAFPALLAVQVTQPLEEDALKKDIPVLSPIRDKVSQAVREQYEQNPYPRWTTIFRNELSEERKEQTRGLDVLVAGCGTGNEAALSAASMPYARVDAVDLSRTSLAYAVRMSRAYGFTNINFMQGDLLELGGAGKTYDFISSGGVLHHLERPEDGLRTLRDILRPRGVLLIGLYSEIARKSIAAMQDWIKKQGFPPTAQGIRRFREAVFAMDESDPLKAVAGSGDFYSLSECRDLLFHVREHRFTCLDLKAILDQLDLRLLAFNVRNPRARVQYNRRFPDDPQGLGLNNWHAFEQDNPQTFIQMYSLLLGRKEEYGPGEMPGWTEGLRLTA